MQHLFSDMLQPYRCNLASSKFVMSYLLSSYSLVQYSCDGRAGPYHNHYSNNITIIYWLAVYALDHQSVPMELFINPMDLYLIYTAKFDLCPFFIKI